MLWKNFLGGFIILAEDENVGFSGKDNIKTLGEQKNLSDGKNEFSYYDFGSAGAEQLWRCVMEKIMAILLYL